MIPRLWLCADLSHPRAATLRDRVRRLDAPGELAVWLRLPATVAARDASAEAHALRAITRAIGAWLVVGDRLDLALAVEADAVHLPARSFAPRRIGELPMRRTRVAHAPADIDAHRRDVVALMVSPFGVVPGKGAALGEEGLRAMVTRARGTPVIALGGVRDASDARRCRAAGASAVAVRSALLDPDDPLPVCASLLWAMRG